MNVQEAILQERIDPYLSDRVLTELARRAGSSGATVHGYRVLTGGCWNRVIGITAAGTSGSEGGPDLVCKISPHVNDDAIIREYRVLEQFARATSLPVPRPLHLETDPELLPGTVLVMTRVPGAVMHECYGLLNYGQRRRITDQIAEDLANLHRIGSIGFGGVEVDPDERIADWPDFWLPRLDRVLDEAAASGSVPAPLTNGARELRPHLRDMLSIGTESTMTHYDIWSGNVMIDAEADPPRVSGYLDVPGYFADYARELSFAMLFGIAGRRFFETYLRSHELDAGFELRANIYNMKMNIKHVQMYPSQAVYQHGAAQNIAYVRRALTE